LRDHFKKLAALAAATLAVAVLAGPAAQAQNPAPANKFAASGSTTEVFGPNTDTTILSEQVKMPTNHELALSVSLECSILTALKLGDDDTGGTDMDSAEGTIDVWIEIDGKRVGVTSGQTGDDRGEVTFCNRAHQVRLSDSETQGTNDPADGIDTLEEYQATKTAAAFNWFALNVGNSGYYDDPANGNNILDVVVKARLESTPNAAGTCELGDQACSQAIIGNRTLLVEPTHASIIEVVAEDGPGGT
jgi:hypothetical protein